jgi:hypothetical protein
MAAQMMSGTPRWLILVLGAALIALGLASSFGLLQDPTLARADYIGTIDVEPADKSYRAVPFEWRVANNAGSFKGNDTAYVKVDPSGEVTNLCGYLKLVDQGASLRAAKWLAEARLTVGDLKVSALFIAPIEKSDEKVHAGCARLQPGIKPAADAPLALDGTQVRE